MDSTTRRDLLPPPVALAGSPDNPERLRPWRNRIAAVAFLTLAVAGVAIAVFAL